MAGGGGGMTPPSALHSDATVVFDYLSIIQLYIP